MNMLELRGADVYYGKAQALHQVSVQVDHSGVLALVGRNGAGKTTILRALMGQLPLKAGARHLDGEVITHLPLSECSRRGIALVPDSREVFSGLTCEENLLLAGLSHRAGHWTMARVYELFPRLQERRKAQGTSLSGGEQQMLSIGRALMTNPKYLLLDEPTEGLAPVVVDQIVEAVQAIGRQGLAVALVEQNFRVPKRLAQRFALIDNGRVTWSGTRSEIGQRLEDMLAGLQIGASA
jgi:branched-chain amino acid transport system ATP-binding protein